MDASAMAADTAGMDDDYKGIEQLLAQARDITLRTLGEAPPQVVAEVFRQLCYQVENEVPPAACERPAGSVH